MTTTCYAVDYNEAQDTVYACVAPQGHAGDHDWMNDETHSYCERHQLVFTHAERGCQACSDEYRTGEPHVWIVSTNEAQTEYHSEDPADSDTTYSNTPRQSATRYQLGTACRIADTYRKQGRHAIVDATC